MKNFIYLFGWIREVFYLQNRIHGLLVKALNCKLVKVNLREFEMGVPAARLSSIGLDLRGPNHITLI